VAQGVGLDVYLIAERAQIVVDEAARPVADRPAQ
jgi:hypothetical protein